MPPPFRRFGSGGRREGDTSFTRTQFDTRADFTQSLIGTRLNFDVLPAPAFVAGGALAQLATASSITASTPAATAIGHYLMAFVTVNATLTNVVTAPAGWALQRVDEDRNGSGLNTSYVFTQFATVSGATSVVFTPTTAANISAVIFAFSGVDTIIPINASAVNAGDGLVFNYVAARVDAPTPSALFVAVRLVSTLNHERINTFSSDVITNYSTGTTIANTYGAHVGTKTLKVAGVPAPTTSFITDAGAGQNAGGIFYSFALRAVGTLGRSVFTSKQIIASSDDASIDTIAATINTVRLAFFPYELANIKNLNTARVTLPAPIPMSATIEKAKLVFVTRNAITVVGAMTSLIQAERAVAPAAFSTFADYNARLWTASSVSWGIAGTFAIDDRVDTPDVTAMVQAIASEFPSSALTSLSFRFSTQATASTQSFLMQSYDQAASKAVTLEIMYSAPAPAGNITGTSTLTAAAATLTGSGTVPTPTITGTAAIIANALTLSASGTATPPSITGTAALSSLSATISGAGTAAAPGIAGTAALSGSSATISASGTAAAPSITGAGALLSSSAMISGSGTATPPIITGTAALIASSATVTSTGAVAAPSISGSGALISSSVTATGAGTATPPGITGTGALSAQGATVTGSGTTAAPGVNGSAALSSSAASASASGTFTPPAITGAGALNAGAVTISSNGTAFAPGINGSAALSVASAVMNAAGNVAPPSITGSSSLTLPRASLAATGTATPPTITGAGAVSTSSATINANGTVFAPGVNGSAVLSTGKASIAAAGTVALPAISAAGALSIPAALLSASGAFTPTAISGAGALSAARVTISANAQLIPAVINGSSSIQARAASISGAGNLSAIDAARIVLIISVSLQRTTQISSSLTPSLEIQSKLNRAIEIQTKLSRALEIQTKLSRSLEIRRTP